VARQDERPGVDSIGLELSEAKNPSPQLRSSLSKNTDHLTERFGDAVRTLFMVGGRCFVPEYGVFERVVGTSHWESLEDVEKPRQDALWKVSRRRDISEQDIAVLLPGSSIRLRDSPVANLAVVHLSM